MLRYDTVDEALNLFAPSEFIVGADEPAEFTPPVEVFPLFKKALAYYQDRNPGHAVQIDTVESYEQMIGAGAFETVPGVVPDGSNDVKAYHDGDCVFVSLLFALPDGSKRVASAAARPMSEESFQGWGELLGADPVAFLAVLPEASRLATGKRLLRSAGDAAIGACSRTDVIGMTAPVLVRGLAETASLAALMWLEQRAQLGDKQALAELAIMHGAAETPIGKKVAAPMLAEASRRLKEAQGR